VSESRDASWDYGLEPGESFEPEGWEEEPFDLTQPHIMTTLGPIDPGALGFALHGQRLLTNAPSGGATDLDFVLDDLAKAASELEGYAVTGGQAIVEIGTGASGRNIGDLLFVAQRSPVHVVVSTGQDEPRAESGEQSRSMVEEITEGIDSTTVRAGLIVLTGLQSIESVATAHRETRAPVLVKLNDRRDVVQAVQTLVGLGVTGARITVSNVESKSLTDVLSTGCFVLFEKWASGDRKEDDYRAREVAVLVDSGFEQQLLISGDLARRSRWLSYGGGPGFVYFIDEVPLMLMEAGLSAKAVRSVFIDNMATALTILP